MTTSSRGGVAPRPPGSGSRPPPADTGGFARLLVFAAVITALWGIAGGLQVGTGGHGGYATGWGAEVVDVEEGGPAAGAGLEPGDRILEAENISVSDPWTRPELAPPRGGGTQTLLIERDGNTERIHIAWQGLSRTHWRSFLVDALVTLAFLGFGLWAFLASRSTAGVVLAVFGIFYALANFPAPSLAGGDVLVRFVQQNLSVLYTAVLFHFMMVFPGAKTVAGKRVPGWLLYVPFLPFLALGLAEWALYPGFLSGYSMIAAATDLLYMLLAIVALAHTWITVSGDERRRTGFNRILWGLAIAIGPFLALGLVRGVLPGAVQTGAEYLPLLGVVLPGSMASAVVVRSRFQRPHQ